MIKECPLCVGRKMRLTRLSCECGKLSLDGDVHQQPLARLAAEDMLLAEELIVCGGNLKTLAEHLGITYPTLRKRLDALIERLKLERAQDTERIEATLSRMEKGELDAEEGIKNIREIKGEL